MRKKILRGLQHLGKQKASDKKEPVGSDESTARDIEREIDEVEERFRREREEIARELAGESVVPGSSIRYDEFGQMVLSNPNERRAQNDEKTAVARSVLYDASRESLLVSSGSPTSFAGASTETAGPAIPEFTLSNTREPPPEQVFIIDDDGDVAMKDTRSKDVETPDINIMSSASMTSSTSGSPQSKFTSESSEDESMASRFTEAVKISPSNDKRKGHTRNFLIPIEEDNTEQVNTEQVNAEES
ncbi:hypothetical protein F4819DRAFT_470428 [Hypoxylon fuscum]|nr:hypothetical protein F4819DRAFT_470428 [Hypoxylon fuscum]